MKLLRVPLILIVIIFISIEYINSEPQFANFRFVLHNSNNNAGRNCQSCRNGRSLQANGLFAIQNKIKQQQSSITRMWTGQLQKLKELKKLILKLNEQSRECKQLESRIKSQRLRREQALLLAELQLQLRLKRNEEKRMQRSLNQRRKQELQLVFQRRLEQRKLADLELKLKQLENGLPNIQYAYDRRRSQLQRRLQREAERRRHLELELKVKELGDLSGSEERLSRSLAAKRVGKNKLQIRLQQEIKKRYELEFNIRLQLQIVKRIQLEIKMKQQSNPNSEELEELKLKLQYEIEKRKQLQLQLQIQQKVVRRIRQLINNNSQFQISARSANQSRVNQNDDNIEEKQQCGEKVLRITGEIKIKRIRNNGRNTGSADLAKLKLGRNIRIFGTV